jgi:hypothetical protein
MRAPKLWLSLVLLVACMPARRAIPVEPARSVRRPESAIANRPRQAAVVDTFLLRLAEVDRATRARDIASWIRLRDDDPSQRAVWVWIEALGAGQQSGTQPGPVEWFLPAALQE